MSDNNNKEPASVVKPSEQASSTNTAPKSSMATGFAFVLLILLVAGSAGGYFLWQKTHEEINLLHGYVSKIEGQLQSKTKSVNEFKRKLSQMSAENKSQDMVLNDHLRELKENMVTLDGKFEKVSNATLSNQVWLLSEVEYLLKTADHRILMKEDVKGAVGILKSADSLIKKMPVEDKGLLNVRVAIARDIASLQAYRDIDVPGTYAQLSALGDQIERLPLITTAFEREPQTESENTNTPPNILAKINTTMQGYLTIKRHDVNELKALLSDEDRRSLRDGLRLAVEQSQTALLMGDQRIYDQSLSKVRAKVHEYFIADNFKVQRAIKKIDALLKIQVRNDLPGISGSQQALKRYLNKRTRIHS